jgi:hypothetical protein
MTTSQRRHFEAIHHPIISAAAYQKNKEKRASEGRNGFSLARVKGFTYNPVDLLIFHDLIDGE